MTVAEIVKMLAKMPQEMEVAVETQDGFSEVYDCEVDKEKSYKQIIKMLFLKKQKILYHRSWLDFFSYLLVLCSFKIFHQ